jgi:1-pyrroline-5-carboxylate dehydrogenase
MIRINSFVFQIFWMQCNSLAFFADPMYHPSRYTVAHIALFRRESVPIRKNWEVGNLMNGVIVVPPPKNEPVLSYAPGSPEREALRRSLKELRSLHLEIPLVIGGKEIRTGRLGEIRIPHEHGTVLATYHKAGPEELRQAVEASRAAWETWSRTPWHHRASVFLRAAELISGPYRMTLNAATMLGQSKTAHQAEIEAACELSDFLRFGVHNMRQIYSVQPGHQGEGAWNRLDYRPLEGFVFAVSPFNFTAIGGNLSASPALMGNTILWKPASTGVFSSHFVMRVFLEAGLPDGVINFLPGDSRDMELLLTHPDLAGVHFTGSTGAFRRIWKTVAANIETYKNYPRLVGETGGKDFAMVHASADPQVVATALVRGAFEYQGQKCSATGLHSEIPLGKRRGGAALPALPRQGGRYRGFREFHGRGDRQNILRDTSLKHRLRERPPERDNRLRGYL